MSTPNLGAASPILDAILRLKQMGSNALNTVVTPVQNAMQHVESGLGFAPRTTHEQGLADINRELNAHNNDAANASFRKPDLSTMKKPLGK